ncbi:MAG: OprD family outer membrane porin [Sulfurimonas sp.]|jgi:imipenem/basic amino acid-specific outer membrane pore|nr:OprD family outer membrane porin [Sulfurimonas sp.]
MKKHIVLSAMVIGLLSSVSVQAADDLSSMFKEGKTSGQIREFTINRNVTDTRSAKDSYERKANTIGGHLKFVTDDFKGLSFGTAFYTTNGFWLGDTKDSTEVDPTLFGVDNEGYAILGEAFIKYKFGETEFIGGRQKITNPMISSDDARMLPNLVETYSITNKNLPDTTLEIAHTTKFAQGTFGRAYGAGGILAATAGYSAVDPSGQVGDFVNMGDYAVGKTTDGVTSLSAVYSGVKGLKVQLWDFYAHDIMNTIYADASYNLKLDSVTPFVAAQFIKQNDVGDNLLRNTAISNATTGELDSMYYGLKAGVSIENFTIYAAYSATTENSDSDLLNGSATKAIISMWGGMPAYTQGMVTRHQFLAGTKASKIAASYSFKDMGPDVKVVGYYANYDMHKNNGYTEVDAKEGGFDIIYNTAFAKGLQLRLRGNYATDFYGKTSDVAPANNGTVSWSEYRFIANYTF